MTSEQFKNYRFGKNTKIAVYDEDSQVKERIITNVVAIDFEYGLIATNIYNKKYEDLNELEWHTYERANIVE